MGKNKQPYYRASQPQYTGKSAKPSLKPSRNHLLALGGTLLLQFLAMFMNMSVFAWLAAACFWLVAVDYVRERTESWRLRIVASCVAALVLGSFTTILLIDRVRGPFAYLQHPMASDYFSLHAGGVRVFKVSELRQGIDLSQAIHFGGRQPITLRIQRRWPFAMHVYLRVNGEKSTLFEIDGKEIKYKAPNIAANYDDTAVELMFDEQPIFQLIVTDEYNVYVNAVLIDSSGFVTTMNGDSLNLNFPRGMLQDTDFPSQIFKYPAYIYLGQRQ